MRKISILLSLIPILSVPIITSCRTVQVEPQIPVEPERPPIVRNANQINYLEQFLNEAELQLESGSIVTAVNRLNDIIGLKQDTEYAFPEAEPLFQSAETLRTEIVRKVRFIPGDEWERTGEGVFSPKNDARNRYTPKFSLVYRDKDRSTPISGISYRFSGLIDGETGENASFQTDTEGIGGNFQVAAGPGPREITCTFEIDEMLAPLFPRLTVSFTVPSEKVVVRVGTGERVADLAKQLTEGGLATMDAVYHVIGTEKYDAHTSVPGPYPYLSRLEGQFRPGEYVFLKTELPELPADGAWEQAVANTRVIFKRLLEAAADRYTDYVSRIQISLYQQYILASMVEKEAVSNKDYREVAAVFVNRLIGGSHLSSCPTVEYALGYHRPFLTRDDIAIDSPYNVYAKPGLPPTPICFFSDEALAAVRDPNRSYSYFFVFDWTTGDLTFARYFEDHEKNVARAKANFIERYGEEALHEIFPNVYYDYIEPPGNEN